MAMRRSITGLIGVLVLAGSAVAAAAPAHSGVPAGRPAAERVPVSVDHVRIAYRDSADLSSNRTIHLRGKRADHIIKLFNALQAEPKNAAHCLAMGTAHTEVTFKNTAHKWVASEAICTNLTVTRDGKPLRTLIETGAWDKALTHYLGHSPTGTGSSAQAN
jgi:hypothetical protein